MKTIKDVVKDYETGKGKYNSTKDSRAWITWNNMLRRCYQVENRDKQWKRYENVTVCDEWHKFNGKDGFCRWYYKNFYQVPGHKMDLDKDLLVKNNTVYSSSRCCFLPHELNSLLTNNKKFRGDLPIGVNKYKDKFKAQLSGIGCLGIFDDPMSAFEAYKEAKEKRIKEVAEEYREYLPSKVIESLYDYEIYITD